MGGFGWSQTRSRQAPPPTVRGRRLSCRFCKLRSGRSWSASHRRGAAFRATFTHRPIAASRPPSCCCARAKDGAPATDSPNRRAKDNFGYVIHRESPDCALGIVMTASIPSCGSLAIRQSSVAGLSVRILSGKIRARKPDLSITAGACGRRIKFDECARRSHAVSIAGPRSISTSASRRKSGS